MMKLSDCRSGSTLDGDCGSRPDVFPDWMDMTKFRRGQAFFRAHAALVTLALHCSLTTGLSVINLLEPLVFTGASNTPAKSMKRYVATAIYLILWHLEDVWDAPNGRAYRSLQTVRRMHKSVAQRMNKAFTDKIYVSQYDMSLVQSGFMGAIVMYPTELGIKCSRQELDDYVFFWRGVGYLIGIDDKYNICSGTLDETINICKEIEAQVLVPGLMDPPKHFNEMAEAYIVGMNQLTKIPLLSKSSTIALSLETMGSPCPQLAWLDWLKYFFLKMFIFLSYRCPGFERLMNLVSLNGYKVYLAEIEKSGSLHNEKDSHW